MGLGFMFTYLCVSAVMLFLYFQWTRRKMYAKLASMSGPYKLPLIGHAHKFYNTKPEALADTLKYFGAFPPPVCIQMGPLPHIAIFDPEHLQVILHSQNCLAKSIHYKFMGVPGTLISAPVPTWKVQRKALNPSLGPVILSTFIPVFNKKSATLVRLLEKHVGKPERDFTKDICKCTLDQIYVTAFGCDFDMQETPDGDNTVDLMGKFMKLLAARFFTVWKYPDFIYRMTEAYREENATRKYYHDNITVKLVQKIHDDEKLAKSIEENQLSEDVGRKKPQNFVECLLKYMHNFGIDSRKEVYPHIDMTLFAGNDTTAKTISSILLLLAIHQEVQERCYQEIMEVCPGDDQFVTAEDIANLPYLDMVCKETMRLYPVVPIMGRITTGDVKLNDEHTIPAGCTIIIGTYQIHRNTRVWGPNADKFDPDNFLPDNAAKRHPYSFIPFSAGPRNCMGMRYAWLSLKTTIVYVLRKYRLRTSITADEVRISYGVMLNIANGCMLTLEAR